MSEPIPPVFSGNLTGTHTLDHSDVAKMPVIPPGMPATDPTKPKWAFTQDQIDYLWERAAQLVPTIKAYWPVIMLFLAGFGITVGSMGVVGGRVTAPTPDPVVIEKPADKPPVVVNVQPATPIVKDTCLNPTGCKCGCVATGKCTCKDCDHPQLKAPTVEPPAIAPALRVMLYVTDPQQAKGIMADPLLKGVAVTLDYTQPIGTVYNFDGKIIQLPCAVIMDATGKVLNVVPFVVAADIAAALKQAGK